MAGALTPTRLTERGTAPSSPGSSRRRRTTISASPASRMAPRSCRSECSNADGDGDAATIARGIRYAVQHGANVINLSLEFSISVTASQIPQILAAIRYAHRHNVVVVAAAGNDSSEQIAYPARAPAAISVGATTADRCIADYSNEGANLDIVAPGGGDDASLASDPLCQPERNLPGIFQMTFNNPLRPDDFSLPSGWYGTSMASAEVAAGAALVIASGVIGRHPTPDQVLARLEQTAQPLGNSTPDSYTGTDCWMSAPRPPGRRARPCRRPQPPRSTRRAVTLASRRPDDQHGARGVMGDLVRHGSEQEPLGSREAAVADDDQVGALLFGDIENRVGRVALARERLDLADAGGTRLGSGLLEDREHVLSRLDHPLCRRHRNALVARDEGRTPARRR